MDKTLYSFKEVKTSNPEYKNVSRERFIEMLLIFRINPETVPEELKKRYNITNLKQENMLKAIEISQKKTTTKNLKRSKKQ